MRGNRAAIPLLDTADHGDKILKPSRTRPKDVFVERARVVRDWAAKWPHFEREGGNGGS